jgi:UbiD family decarboxylase
MTKIHDLRSYLELLASHHNLVRVERSVSLKHELANLAVSLQRQLGKACLFENVEKADWPVFANAVSTPEQAALALECQLEEVSSVMERALDPSAGIPTEQQSTRSLAAAHSHPR